MTAQGRASRTGVVDVACDHAGPAKARNSRTISSAAGWAAGDHICWAYEGASSWQTAATNFLASAADTGEALLYTADKSSAGLIADLSGLAGRDALLAAGRLTVVPTAELYGDPADFGPAQQVHAVRERASTAVRNGYTGLRVATEVTSLVPDEDAARRFAEFELAVDSVVAGGTMSGICGYDQTRLGPELSSVLSVHPLRHAGMWTGYAFHAEVDGWRVAGEVDCSVEDDLRAALAVACADGSDGDVHLRVERLRFIDVVGARTLVDAAERLAAGRRLVLHGLSHGPRSVFRLTGWDRMPKLALEGSG